MIARAPPITKTKVEADEPWQFSWVITFVAAALVLVYVPGVSTPEKVAPRVKF